MKLNFFFFHVHQSCVFLFVHWAARGKCGKHQHSVMRSLWKYSVCYAWRVGTTRSKYTHGKWTGNFQQQYSHEKVMSDNIELLLLFSNRFFIFIFIPHFFTNHKLMNNLHCMHTDQVVTASQPRRSIRMARERAVFVRRIFHPMQACSSTSELIMVRKL